MVKKDKITKEIIEKYYDLSFNAFEIAQKTVSKSKKKNSEEIFLIVKCYLEDSLHFKEKKDYVNAYGSLNYAHGWLDCGARLKIFKVK